MSDWKPSKTAGKPYTRRVHLGRIVRPAFEELLAKMRAKGMDLRKCRIEIELPPRKPR